MTLFHAAGGRWGMMCFCAKGRPAFGDPLGDVSFVVLRTHEKAQVEFVDAVSLFHPSAQRVSAESESEGQEETGGEEECASSQASGSTYRMSVVNVLTQQNMRAHKLTHTN